MYNRGLQFQGSYCKYFFFISIWYCLLYITIFALARWILKYTCKFLIYIISIVLIDFKSTHRCTNNFSLSSLNLFFLLQLHRAMVDHICLYMHKHRSVYVSIWWMRKWVDPIKILLWIYKKNAMQALTCVWICQTDGLNYLLYFVVVVVVWRVKIKGKFAFSFFCKHI